MSRKRFDYLGGHTVIHTGRGTEGDLVRKAFVHQLESTYAQREFDEQREAERKNILERIEQADRDSASASRLPEASVGTRQMILASFERFLRSARKDCREKRYWFTN